MTLQERYAAIKEEAAQLGQAYQQARTQLGKLEQQMIRADAQMALLEALMTAESAAPKAESDVT